MSAPTLLLFLALVPAAVSADFFDGDVPLPQKTAAEKKTKPLLLGLDLAWSGHVEEGLDRSKGEYSTSYAALGGFFGVEYHEWSEFFLRGGLGIMRLTGLRVNSRSQSMESREQWHVPFYVHAFYKIDELFAVGMGFTHLIETTMYLNSQPVPQSSFNHIFLDLVLQVRPRVGEKLQAIFTGIIGLNLIPGRQNTYSVFDLLHLRFQIMAGVGYSLF